MNVRRSAKNLLRPVYHAMLRAKGAVLDRLTLRWGASPSGARVYYGLVSGAFARERRAVLAGRAKYLDRSKVGDGSVYLLRRNIHRIEKGLIMEPRRATFAADYIAATVATFERLKREGDGVVADDLIWAEHVLQEYFASASGDRRIDGARLRFDQIEREIGTAHQRIPFKGEQRAKCTVTYDAIHALALRRRSVRWFRSERVDRALVDKALLVARQAPSACNRQPYRFVIFDDPAEAAAIGAIPGGTAGFARNFPVVAIVVGDLSAYSHERDRHAIYTDGALAVMSFILALETLGLSSCCINWPDVERLERRMDAALKLERHERPIMLVAIGYADESRLIPYSQKAPLTSVRQYAS